MENEKLNNEMNTMEKAANPTDIRHSIKMVAVLTIICAIIALLLSVVNEVTKDTITENSIKARDAAILKVYPDGDLVEAYGDDGTVESVYNDETVTGKVFLIYKEDAFIGYCVNVAPNGYENPIDMMVGLDTEKIVSGISIVSMKETAGVGSKTNSDSFLSQFLNKQGPFTVGESIDAIAGATISSKAVTNGVNMAMALVEAVENSGDEITEPVETEPAETYPAETETAETEAVETETTETETDAEETETEVEETEPVETDPPETQPVVTWPQETNPPETQPVVTWPQETNPPETEAPEIESEEETFDFETEEGDEWITEPFETEEGDEWVTEPFETEEGDEWVTEPFETEEGDEWVTEPFETEEGDEWVTEPFETEEGAETETESETTTEQWLPHYVRR